jgi:thiol:disulfide interchange protein DsbD
MAAPFLLIAAWPRALAWLPKPGAWMTTFKHALGWPMLLTALWLAYVFQSLTGQVATFGLLLGALALAFALWLYGQKTQGWRMVLAIGVSFGTLYGIHALSQPKTTPWQPWSAAAVAEAQTQNRPIFIDFTADWCLTCKVTEATVLNTQSVQNLFQQHNVVTLQADWTARDDTITAELAKHGRQGVPLYLLYLPGQPEPIILPQLLSFGVLDGALNK